MAIPVAVPATIPAAMVRTFSPGSAATVPRPTIRAPRARRAPVAIGVVQGATVAAAGTAAAGMVAEAAINPANSWENRGFLICRNPAF